MHKNRHPNTPGKKPVTIFGPDFPFAFDDWIEHPAGLGSIPADKHGQEVAIVGAGISGLVAASHVLPVSDAALGPPPPHRPRLDGCPVLPA